MKQTAIFWLILLASLAFASTIPAQVNQLTEVGDSFFNLDGSPVLAPNCTLNIYFSNGSAYNVTNFNMGMPNAQGVFAAKVNFTTNDTFNAQMNCTDQTGIPQAPETIYIDAKTNAFIAEQTDNTPLTVTITFIAIIILFFIAAARATSPFNTLFASFGCISILAFLMVCYSFLDPNSVPARLLEPAILFSIQIAPIIAGIVIMLLLWNEAKKTIFFKNQK